VKSLFLLAVFITLAVRGGEPAARDGAASIESLAVRGTILARGTGEARELILEVETKAGGAAGPGTLVASYEGKTVERAIEKIEPGVHVYEVGIPVPAAPGDADFTLRAGGGQRTARARIAPPRPFTVYLAPLAIWPSWDELDRVLGRCRATDEFPEDSKFRFTSETAVQVDRFLGRESAGVRKELIARVKEGRIELTGLQDNLRTGLASGEELCRAVYPAGRFRRDLGALVDTAISTRRDGFTWALPSVLAGAGIRYLSVGSSDVRGRPPIPPGERLFEWRSSGGVGVLVHWSDLKDDGAAGLGEGFAEARKNLPERLARMAEEGYPRPEVLLLAPNAGPEVPHLARTWNERYSNPRVIVATVGQFFRKVAGGGGKFPVFQKAWTDALPPLDDQRSVAFHAQDLVSAVEALSAAALVLDPLWPYPARDFDSIYKDLLSFDDSPLERRSELKVKVSAVLVSASDAFFTRVAPPGSRVVVNPLAWTRDGAPEAKGWIPGLGYSVFRGEARDVPAVTVGEDSIESPFYRVRLNARRTAIASIFDKRMGMELLDPASPFGGAEFLGVIDDPSKTPPAPTEGRVVERASAPGSGVLVFEARGDDVGRVQVTVILYGDLLRMDLEVRIPKDLSDDRPERRLAFPFAGAGPRLRCGLPGGAMNLDEDRPAGAAREPIVIDRWISVSSPRLAIAWSSPDAPKVELGRIGGADRPLVLSRTSGVRTIVREDILLRYAIASAPEMSDLAAAQMAAEHATPLLREGPPGIGADPGKSESFLSLEDGSKGAMITTFKRAEDGDGFVVRILDHSSDTRQAILRSAWPIQLVQFADVLETPRAALAAADNTARVYLKGPGFTTLRIKFGK
jgi:glycosyl hydrolase family 38